LFGWLFDWLVGYFIVSLVICLFGWLVILLVGWLFGLVDYSNPVSAKLLVKVT